MTETITRVGFHREAFKAFLQSRGEPDWLRELREKAWTQFEALPAPSQRDEEWMRTDIRLFRWDKFGLPADTAAASSADSLLTRGVQLGGQVTAVDSRPHAARLEEKWRKRGVLFGSLDELVKEQGDLIRPHLFRAFNMGYDKFAALHAAAWSGGALLYVPRGVTIDEPLHMLSVLSPGASDFGHALVILEEGAEATLLAETASTTEGTAGLH
jgi:Fe-S cluster assembly protein SufD